MPGNTEFVPFAHDLSPLLTLSVTDEALASLSWKDFGNGSSMARIKRDGAAGLVVYRIAPDADCDAFLPHIHTGGEAYLVLRGSIADHTGTYGPGSLVWNPPGSQHNPRGVGDTVVLVLWPGGVETPKG